jgi:hypothetical protein
VGATAASLAAHLVVFALMALGTRSLPSAEPPRAFDVDLVRPLVLPPPERKLPSVVAARRPPPAASNIRATVSAPPEVVAPFVVRPPGVEGPSAPPAEDPALAAARQAVREGYGCDRKLRFRLSAAELAACDRHERQYAARKGQGPGATASLDLEGRFVKDDDEPYLSRMPKKGCKPRVSGMGGDAQDDRVIVGLACVLRF